MLNSAPIRSCLIVVLTFVVFMWTLIVISLPFKLFHSLFDNENVIPPKDPEPDTLLSESSNRLVDPSSMLLNELVDILLALISIALILLINAVLLVNLVIKAFVANNSSIIALSAFI